MPKFRTFGPRAQTKLELMGLRFITDDDDEGAGEDVEETEGEPEATESDETPDTSDSPTDDEPEAQPADDAPVATESAAPDVSVYEAKIFALEASLGAKDAVIAAQLIELNQAKAVNYDLLMGQAASVTEDPANPAESDNDEHDQIFE